MSFSSGQNFTQANVGMHNVALKSVFGKVLTMVMGRVSAQSGRLACHVTHKNGLTVCTQLASRQITGVAVSPPLSLRLTSPRKGLGLH